MISLVTSIMYGDISLCSRDNILQPPTLLNTDTPLSLYSTAPPHTAQLSTSSGNLESSEHQLNSASGFAVDKENDEKHDYKIPPPHA